MRKVLSKDGTPIAFDQSGRGPAIILVAGASGTRLDQAAVAAALSPDFTVFAYDRRGRGDSGDTLPYAVEREVEDIEALIDEAGSSAFVFGHSSGAILALEAARQIPTKIGKLALYEPPFVIDDSRPPAPKDYVQRLTELVSSGHRGEAVEYFMSEVGLPPEMIAQMRQSPAWPGLEKIAPTLAYDATIVGDTQSGDPRTLGKWASVSVPTLVMDGTMFLGREETHTFMRTGAQEITKVLPHAQHRTLQGQDHGPAADVLASALKEFLLGS
ncbi:MAG: alpha/beta hydrolase [Ktedonobacteraceae bacterium]|nr:alpha/beta hydrolase [Ktedonobacteraceae bacterium]